MTFLVKPAHADATRRGLTMYPLNERGAPRRRFEQFAIITTPEAADGARWDQVYLAVPSTALRPGDWIAPLGRATGDATVVFLPPNLDDRARLTASIAAERLVDGMIGFISYATPLPGETRFAEPGMAYWFPPLSPSPFSGTPARVDAVVTALRRGGLPATRHRDVTRMLPFPNAILYAYLAALELADWSFATLRRGDRLTRAGQAAREAMAIAAHSLGTRVPWRMRPAGWSIAARMILRLAPWIVPLPLEAYLRAHFTKIGGQVRLGLHGYLRLGAAAGLPTTALTELTAALPPGAGSALDATAGRPVAEPIDAGLEEPGQPMEVAADRDESHLGA